jgi:hypothetical protein
MAFLLTSIIGLVLLRPTTSAGQHRVNHPSVQAVTPQHMSHVEKRPGLSGKTMEVHVYYIYIHCTIFCAASARIPLNVAVPLITAHAIDHNSTNTTHVTSRVFEGGRRSGFYGFPFGSLTFYFS